MINSKGIRILCYIAVGISYFATLCLLIAGIVNMVDENYGVGIFFVLLCGLIPLFVNLSIYPLFALSKIESNTETLNNQLNDIITLLKNPEEPMEMPLSNQTNSNFTSPPTTPPTSPQPSATPIFVPGHVKPGFVAQAIDFINEKYQVDINLDDDYFSIKEKISEIEVTNKSVEIFKNRVIDATSYDEVINAINLHRVATHKDNDPRIFGEF